MEYFQSFSSFQKSYPNQKVSVGKIFIFPTETFYAIGCLGTCDSSVQKIYAIKNRKLNFPLLVLVDSYQMLTQWANVSNMQGNVIQNIGEGVATIILHTEKLSSYLNFYQKNNTYQTIGFRITSHPVAKQLIDFFQQPIVGTSANISGNPSAYCYSGIPKELLSKVDFSINTGKTAGGNTSSLLNFHNFPKIQLLRKGKLSEKKLQNIAQKYQLIVNDDT